MHFRLQQIFARKTFERVMLALSLGLAGCSQNSPTQPVAAAAPMSRLDAPSPANVLRVSAPPAATRATPSRLSANAAHPDSSDWQVVGSVLASPGAPASLDSGRYRLLVENGCVDTATVFTIATYDSTVLDVELGPHAKTFGRPLELTIDYAGTQADPASPDFDGTEPRVYWYNENGGVWVPMPCTVDAEQLTVTVRLVHFSRYAVGAKASW